MIIYTDDFNGCYLAAKNGNRESDQKAFVFLDETKGILSKYEDNFHSIYVDLHNAKSSRDGVIIQFEHLDLTEYVSFLHLYDEIGLRDNDCKELVEFIERLIYQFKEKPIKIINTDYERTLSIDADEILGPSTKYVCAFCGYVVKVYEVKAIIPSIETMLAERRICFECLDKMAPRTMNIEKG